MGEIVHTVSDISHGYKLYLLLITYDNGASAQKAAEDLFVPMAHEIGREKVITRFTEYKEITKLEKSFGIKNSERRPILLIMESHPEHLQIGQQVIKLELGRFENPDDVRHTLTMISKMVRDDEFGKINWELRKKRFAEIAPKIPFVNIITMALGYI